MVSVAHLNAASYFERDQEGVISLFKRRYGFECDRKYDLKDIEVNKRLDLEIKASGCFS
jgi:RIO-like serine/threonine protein kinase